MRITQYIEYCDNDEWKEELINYQTNDIYDALDDAERFEKYYNALYNNARVTTYIS